MEVTGGEYTVGQLQQTLQDITGVPVTAQKIIFKGIQQPSTCTIYTVVHCYILLAIILQGNSDYSSGQ